MTEIREASERDLPAIRAAWPVSPGTPGDPHGERFSLHESGALTWLVAWADARPCGAVWVRWRAEAELTEQARHLGCPEIAALDVDEDLRGQGIGRALMEAAIERVRRSGADTVGLEVTAHNPNQVPARALYESLGFTDAGFGEFISGYTYWDAQGKAHRDEEPHRYLVKRL